MDYFNNVSYLTLDGHVELQKYRYIYFVFSLTVYIVIICVNVVVISVIYTNRHLHEPMYIFIAALLCNALFGTTAFYPKLLIDFLSERQMIYYQTCLFQAFCIYTYAVSEFTLLSVMAYDRHVSICKPLLYSTIVKMSTVRKLLFLSWLLPCSELAVGAILTSQLHLCKFTLNKIYCDNFSIVKLSCTDTSVNNFYGLFIFGIAIFPPLIFIVYSYVKILSVCLRNSKDFRRKTLQTCLPHLFILINFSVNVCFEVINNRLESNMPHIISVIMSVVYLTIPPLFNPIIYGLKLQEISKRIKMFISGKNRTLVSF